MSEVPDEVRALAAERTERRADRDFAAADAIRDRIAELGFRIVDGPGGPSFEPIASSVAERDRADQIQSLLDGPATRDVSVHWVVQGWPEDVVRALAAFRANQAGRDVQYVVADLTETDPAVYGAEVEVLTLEPSMGWGAARNAGLKRSAGRIVLAVDGSIEPTGDIFDPLLQALQDPTIGICGPFGISTHDLHEFHDSPGPEVDAVEGYLMAFRREVLLDVGLFDDKFRWYRTADIDFSFRVKDTGLRAVVVAAPVTRHEHRMYHSTAPDERDRLSKRNYYRFLERFRGRFDLLVDPTERDQP